MTRVIDDIDDDHGVIFILCKFVRWSVQIVSWMRAKMGQKWRGDKYCVFPLEDAC